MMIHICPFTPMLDNVVFVFKIQNPTPPANDEDVSDKLDDQNLVQRCRDGDKHAFRILVARYQKKLFSIAFGMLHHPEDALDVVQEAFLKVHRYLPKFQGNSSFYTWIYRIVVNLCIDFLRKESRHQAMDYDDGIQHNSETQQALEGMLLCSQAVDPIKALKNKELGQHIIKAIETLSPNHRAVISLREIEGMSYEEIAQTLECSKGTVMSRLHHARAKLRQQLQQYVDVEKTGDKSEEKGGVAESSSPA
tara:strand:+ start:10675 stop:11424 length:750 start_codon:yes stop_codon:yes gene_type:complete